MTILDEIHAEHQAAGGERGPLGGGHRAALGRRLGLRAGGGRVLTNAHNVRGDHVVVTFADGTTAEGSVAGRESTVTSPSSTSPPARLPPWRGRPPRQPTSGRRFRAVQSGRAWAARDLGIRLRRRADLPRPARAAVSPAASSTPPRSCPAPRAARSWTPGASCSGSTPTASARVSTWLYRPTRNFAAGPRAGAAGSSPAPAARYRDRSRARGAAAPARRGPARRRWRAHPGCDGGQPGRTRRPVPGRPGRGGRRPAGPHGSTTCSTRSGRRRRTLELTVVRGADERTIRVVFGENSQPGQEV